jgi:hypothetical protein
MRGCGYSFFDRPISSKSICARKQAGQKQRTGLPSFDTGVSASGGSAGRLVHQHGSVATPSTMPHENIVPQREQVLIEM